MKEKILKLPKFLQTSGKSSCGPVSLKMILGYYGVEKSEKELIKLCKTTKQMGTSAENIVRVAKFLGFKSYIKNNTTYSDIAHLVNKKIPVIVNWFSRGQRDWSDSDVAVGHYSVVVGIDDKNIYIQDPQTKRIKRINKNDFLSVWFDFKGNYIRSPKDLVLRRMIVVYK